MNAKADPVELCNEIAGELTEISKWLCAGQVDPARFRAAVLTLEAAKVARHGFRLTGVGLRDGGSHFELRFADSGELCASLEFDPTTQELSVEHICE